MKLHLIAFLTGFFLDLIFGDPVYPFHPVRLMGAMIARLEKRLNKMEFSPAKKRAAGTATVILVCAVAFAVSAGLLAAAYFLNPILGLALESFFTYQILAAKSLKAEAMKVYKALEKGTLDEARRSVSMIVGRDTKNLSEEGVIRAAVESVAESTNDGVIAPLFYCALGGPALGFFYKSISTMDSMLGYKNERFLDFGRAAARTDDFANFIPSRLGAFFMLLSCLFCGKRLSFRRGARIFFRDRLNHQSPNSAQTESVCAGALGLRLGGPAYYGGSLEQKPFIGDDLREPRRTDIKDTVKLMYCTAFLFTAFCAAIMLLLLSL